MQFTTMNDEKQPQVNRKEERRSWVWIMLMVNIVFILLLMTLGIIALQVGNKLPENTDILFIVGKSPSVEVGDSKKWEAGQEVDIFKASYVNGQGQTTVLSQDGTALIAPGTKTEYKFSMYNNGNMAVVYETDIDFTLTVGDESLKQYTFPLKVRLYTENGAYMIGSKTDYVHVENATLSAHVSQLGANSYETFVLELMWEFDGGNDELDTLYGDKAVESGVSLTMGINTYAEEHVDPTAQGGTKIEVEGNEEYGGTIRWLWLILLFINAGILIFYVSWLLNKRLRKW
ncbi:MAG: hypothetical protein J6B79_04520 [Clostridia bacterium]|nr:hypothetical protein [Clostridia bacterium]